MNRTVFYLSDGTGITAETLGHTLLTQFDSNPFRQVTLPFIDSVDKASAVVQEINCVAAADGCRPIVFSTLIDAAAQEQVAQSNALVLDLFSVFIRPLELELAQRSSHTTGRSHGMADRASYGVRIEALNFALHHDDGASTKHYGDADVILIGASRTGKTPTCLYLAMHFGICAANYPITVDDLDSNQLPRVLWPHRERLYGLTIDPERLHQIRNQRRPGSEYASLPQCRKELRHVESVYRSEGISSLNTATMSIEEIASRVLQDARLERRLF